MAKPAKSNPLINSDTEPGLKDLANWVSPVVISQTVGLHPNTLRRIAKNGLIRVWQLPTCRPRYYAPDVLKLAPGGGAATTTPAAPTP